MRLGQSVDALAASSGGGNIAADQTAANSVQVLYALRPVRFLPQGTRNRSG